MISLRAKSFLLVSLDLSLGSTWMGRVATKGVDVGITVVLVRVVAGESTLVSMDIRVSACSIHMIVNCFSRATKSTSSCKMLGIDFHLLFTESSSSPCGSWLVANGEAAAVEVDISVSSCAVSVVDLCASSACQDAHAISVKYIKRK